MLHNYGGRRGLYGNLEEIASQPLIDFARANGTMVGLCSRGLTACAGLVPFPSGNHCPLIPANFQVGMGITPEAIEVRLL